MRLRRPLRWMLVLAVVLLVAVAWRATHEPSSLRMLARHTTPIGELAPSEPNDEGRPAAAVGYAHDQAERRAAVIDLDRARRDALRERILEREVQARARAAAQGDAAGGGEEDDAEAVGPGLTDRIGDHETLVAALNREFLPLAHECIDDASQRNPAMAGMLAIELELVGDPDLGAVIDHAGYPAANEIDEPELLECIRETALAASLPAPAEGGRTVFTITMPVGDEPPASG